MPLGIDRLPPGPTALWEAVKKLRQDFDQFRAARRLENASIGAGGLEVTDGGTFQVLDPDGTRVLYVGAIGPDHPDSSHQYATVLRREDGSVALSVWTASGVGVQPVQIWDVLGNIIFADDLQSGGLARPYLPLPVPTAEDISAWPSTAATTWTTLARSRGIIQHPRLHVRADIAVGVNSAQIRLLVDGTAVTTSGVNTSIDAIVSVPNYTFGMESEFQLQAQVTAGGGTVSAMTRYLYGVQS